MKSMEIISTIFPDHCGMEKEINTGKKDGKKTPECMKSNQHGTNNKQTNKQKQRSVRKSQSK